MSLRQLDREVSPQELDIWAAFDERTPIGEFGSYFRSAVQTAMFHNTQVTKKKHLIDERAVFPSAFEKTRQEAEAEEREVAEAVADAGGGMSALAGLAAALGATRQQRPVCDNPPPPDEPRP